MEDIVEGHRYVGLIKLTLNFGFSLSQINSFVDQLTELLEVKNEAGDGGSADEVRVGVILDHESTMIDQGSTAKAFDDKVLTRAATVVRDRDLYDALVYQDKLVGNYVLLADGTTFFVGDPLHIVDDLLLGVESECSEVTDLIHLYH